jgi:tRNA/rRNA methyltransferase
VNPVTSESQLDNLVVVLVATRNPLNIGAAARALANFGVSRLRVVNPYAVAFREAKSAVGASALLKKAEEFSSVAEAIADCALVVGTTAARERELHHRLHTLKTGANAIRKRLTAGHVALLFGSEKRGLSNEDFSHCHCLMRIPTRPEQPSMNLGQAVAVCLYEIAGATKLQTAPADREPPATAAALERLSKSLLEALLKSGYVLSSESGEQKLRRLVRRLKLSESDAQLLLGMLRQMLWKMQRCAK